MSLDGGLNQTLRAMATANPPLTADQQRELAERGAKGDTDAAETLVRTSLRFIIQRAGRIGKGRHMDALVQAGMVGMFQAIRRYRPEAATNCNFLTYAVFWVNREIIHELGLLSGTMVRVPRRALSKRREHLLEGEDLIDAERALTPTADVTSPVVRKAEPLRCGPDVEAECCRRDLAVVMSTLTEHERTLMNLYHVSGVTQVEIARNLRVSKQRVNQILEQSFQTLQQAARWTQQRTATAVHSGSF